MLLVPTLAGPYYGQGPAVRWTAEWWLSHTPLHALWEGKAAVYVFFILSGLVLAQMVTKGDRFDWRAYYPQRLARLYLPVWAAVLFTVATFWVVPRTGAPSSAWLDERPEAITVMAFLKDMTLLLGNGGLASPLWSLRFEILFSLTLPLYMWASRFAPKLTYVKVVVCLVIITLGGYLNNTTLLYVPMFLIGTLFATESERLRSMANNIGGHKFGWPVTAGVATLLMASNGIVGGFGVAPGLQGAMSGLTTIGASLLVLAATHWAAARDLLERRTVQWLGTVSFSLYLVHEPIVVAFGFLFGSNLAILAIVVAVVTSLMVAQLFQIFIEKPSHKFSKRLGASLSSKRRSSTREHGIG
ncbi:hypothetical protein ASG79_10680 [Arthrobacter sp. Soil761]|nr:hypothetical protein ASG79_10680 [Arthrobacter sp. Soil761]